MAQQMERLETAHLIIRHFTMNDLTAVHQILDLELKNSDFGTEA